MIACSHCKQEYPKNALKNVTQDNGETLYFCCNGCELAFELLRENHLESFYNKLGDKTLQTKNMQDSTQNLNYDSINFKQKYLKNVGELQEFHCIIDGIVCAACVWLNEQFLTRLHGIKEIQINYTTHKARILFDESEITLSQIIQHIQKIGYNAIIYDPKDKEVKDLKRNNKYYIKLVIAIFCTMNIMWVNVGQYLGFFSHIDSTSSTILNFASFLLATPVLFFCASDFYTHALKGLRHGIIGMETLVVTGTSLVYCYSIYAWLSKSGHTYFESVCMIILFVLSAKFLESLSRKNANDNLDKLQSLLPLEARLEDGRIISVHDIQIDDRLLVLPGEILACDGILCSEFATLDCSNINGESLHVEKKENDEIAAGSIAVLKPFVYQVKKVFEDSSMSKLTKLLAQSEFSTPKIASFALKIAGYFSRIVLSIAFLGFCYHYFLAQSGFEYALLIAVSVIVIACPCALALATPIASVVGLNVGYKNHVIFTKADFLESLAKSDCVIFDKTGTLTQGKMQLNALQYFENKDFESFLQSHNKHSHNKRDSIHNDLSTSYLSFLTFLMQNNPHPIAYAIVDSLAQIQTHENPFSHKNLHFELLQGKGFYAKIDNLEILGGNEMLMQEYKVIESYDSIHNQATIYTLQSKSDSTQCFIQDTTAKRDELKNMTHFYVAMRICSNSLIQRESNSTESLDSIQTNYKIQSIFFLQDSLKSSAKTLVQSLQKLHKEIIIMSGDRQNVVANIADKLHVTRYYANTTPLQKAEFVQKMIQEGKKIVMVGDGLNDSLALKYAQVGIVMGSGSEVSIAYSDIIILDDKLESLLKAFVIAQKTFSRIKENLIMSLLYNIIAIPLALCGFVIPLFAAAFMSLSSVSVVLNSLRLYKNKL